MTLCQKCYRRIDTEDPAERFCAKCRYQHELTQYMNSETTTCAEPAEEATDRLIRELCLPYPRSSRSSNKERPIQHKPLEVNTK
jgi:hypothetical protein